MKNVFKTNMEFSTTKFENFYKATNSISPCYIEQIACIGWVASYEDPKWKQTGLSYEDAVKEFGFENVKAKPNGCVNGDWLIEVKDGFTSDEMEFDTPTQAIAWLETKVPFSMKLAEFI